MKKVSCIKLVLLSSLSMAILWGCNAAGDTIEPGTAASTAVVFSAADNWGDGMRHTPQPSASRATANGTFDIGDKIGVSAYYTEERKDIGTPNFMYNQPLTMDGWNSWSYSPVKYWPANGTVSFFAYYPHNTSGLTLSPNTATGFPALDYKAPNANTDLLVSTPLLHQTFQTANGKVPLEMNHALIRVEIYVRNSDNVAEKSVTAFSIEGAQSGTLTFTDPINSKDGFEWVFPSTATLVKFSAPVSSFTVPATPEKKELLHTFFLLPKGAGNTFDITYTYTGSNGLETIVLKDQALPSLDKWQAGVSISYTISIDNKVGASVTSDLYPSWNAGTSETVGGVIEK